MRAAVRDRYGPPEVVRVDDVPMPVPTGDQVLVRVHAASVNRADLDNLYPRWAFLRLVLGLRRPRDRRLGLDAAGIVEAVGPDVTRFKPGDRVFGDLYAHGLGALAEYVCTRERAFQTLPEHISFEDGAALPHSAVLALQGLRFRGRTVGPGDHVLVIGASGNVGPFAVQIARAAGAEVTGSARTAKLDLVHSVGADHVIDYTTTDALAEPDRYDWILDVDGNTTLRKARRALRPGGIYLTLGGSGRRVIAAMVLGPLLSRRSGGRHVGLMLAWKPFAPNDVAILTALHAAGSLTPAIDRRFSLSDVVAALRHLDDGRSRGKVLILPIQDPLMVPAVDRP